MLAAASTPSGKDVRDLRSCRVHKVLRPRKGSKGDAALNERKTRRGVQPLSLRARNVYGQHEDCGFQASPNGRHA